jgi:hypothetical protein
MSTPSATSSSSIALESRQFCDWPHRDLRRRHWRGRRPRRNSPRRLVREVARRNSESDFTLSRPNEAPALTHASLSCAGERHGIVCIQRRSPWRPRQVRCLGAFLRLLVSAPSGSTARRAARNLRSFDRRLMHRSFPSASDCAINILLQ